MHMISSYDDVIYIYIYKYVYIHRYTHTRTHIDTHKHTHIHAHTHTHIYIYIYCHPQTVCFVLSELFSVARHVGCSKQISKPVQIYVRLSFRPLGQPRWLREFFKVLWSNSSSSVRLFTFVIPYRLPECSILSKSFALCERRPKIPLSECSTPMGAYIYIYIYECGLKKS